MLLLSKLHELFATFSYEVIRCTQPNDSPVYPNANKVGSFMGSHDVNTFLTVMSIHSKSKYLQFEKHAQ